MSHSELTLSPGFAEFADVGKFTVRRRLSEVEVADYPGGEIRFYIRDVESGVYLLSRAERSENERIIMWSPDLVDLERYLTMEVGDHIREMRGLARINWPFWPSEIIDDLTVVEVEAKLLAVKEHSGRLLPPRFRDSGNPQPAVRFSSLVSADVVELRKSLLDPEGLPLFTLR